MTVRRVLVAALLLAFAVPLSAQGGPLTLLRMLFVLQRQVDALQARQDGDGDLRMRLNLESAYFAAPGTVAVTGWAFACDDPAATVTVVIDGVQTVQSGVGGTSRYPRTDVAAAYAGLCLVPSASGVFTPVAMDVFEPGWAGNHQHTVRLRIYDGLGRMAESNILAVTTQ